ncbi:WxL domain-containing protein [Enterococcus sp. 5H]|uniref:WxL domain-containing protein n=1 Tax=Enterococcus sp. 5H TaxID=1229490 RepID=UPI002303D544|nr:WxL domain-containing protein [Enterococcus sp. 5H]MDA9472579.1 hypothetical protein [Enterococcus sp. 5H]
MKTSTLVTMTGIISLTAIALSGVSAQAVTATTAQGDSEGTVTLKKTVLPGGSAEVVDPGTVNPAPVAPVTPPEVKPEVGDETASMVYYPDFEFGEHTYQITKAATYDAIAPVFKDADNKDKAIPNFVQVDNSPEAATWKVSVKATEFTAAGASKSVLPGAQMNLNNVVINNQLGNAAKTPAASYTLTPGSSVTVGTYTKPENDPYNALSINSIVFGSTSSTTTGEKDESGDTVTYNSGVQLTLPSGLSIQNTTYTSDLEWTMESTI